MTKQQESTILYIDGNDFNQRLVCKILEPAGFHVERAGDGLQGIKKAIDLVPDLILLELHLPYVDGYGVTMKIKSMPDLEHIPVVALTSKRAKDEQERAIASGCDAVLEKPIDVNTFGARVGELLSGRHENLQPLNRTQMLRDFSASLVDKLREKVEELENTNRELAQRKSQIKEAFERSQMANQELKRINQLKENIVAITSHELRTPMSLAVGYLDVLLRGMVGPTNDEQRRLLEICQQSLDRINKLIDRISDLSRIEKKKIPYDLEVVDLNDVFRQAYEGYSVFTNLRGISFEDQLSESPLWVNCDADLLEQVFSNLLKNALCYTRDKGQLVARSWQENGEILFSLKDTGIGISKDNLDQVFEDFFQVQDHAYHRSGSFEFMTRGIGVGLTFCKGILEELGGTIWAASEGLDRGSTFTLKLPQVEPHESIATA